MHPEPTIAMWSLEDGGVETLRLAWDNSGWTAEGTVAGVDAQYVVRLSPDWAPRQFLLFRDLPDPDLWLAVDPSGRWGEMNGAYRPELDRCRAVGLRGTAFLALLAIRTLRLAVGATSAVVLGEADPETLQVDVVGRRWTRVGESRWRVEPLGAGTVEFDLDEHGLPADAAGVFRRIG